MNTPKRPSRIKSISAIPGRLYAVDANGDLWTTRAVNIPPDGEKWEPWAPVVVPVRPV